MHREGSVVSLVRRHEIRRHVGRRRRRHRPRDRRSSGSAASQRAAGSAAPVVVVSALSGVTDGLIAVAQLAEDGERRRRDGACAHCSSATSSVATAVTSDSRARVLAEVRQRVRRARPAWCTRWRCCAKCRRARSTRCSPSASWRAAASSRRRWPISGIPAPGSTRAGAGHRRRAHGAAPDMTETTRRARESIGAGRSCRRRSRCSAASSAPRAAA